MSDSKLKLQNKKIFIIILAVILSILNFNTAAASFEPERANFSVIYQNHRISLKKFSLFLKPGEKIKLKAVSKDWQNDNYSFSSSSGNFLYRKDSTLSWQAPSQSGYYEMKITNNNSNSENSIINLNIFVLHPFEDLRNGYIENFRIGEFPKIPNSKKDHYEYPKGFLKIEDDMLNLKLSPHFRLSQFTTRQTDSYPQFIVIKESLLLKLEELLYQVNENGFDVNTFSIVSAFRSPYFNKLIGNNTDLSRHVFGDAADIYIDNTKDSWMDDLNSDGNININDALILERMAAEFDRNKKYSYLAGGLSSYKSNCVRGPFIHIDTRGYHVRW